MDLNVNGAQGACDGCVRKKGRGGGWMGREGGSGECGIHVKELCNL